MKIADIIKSVCGLLVAGLFHTSPAAALTIGTADTGGAFGNTFPFGNSLVTRYQQAYSASNFTSAITISGINFFAATESGNLGRSYTGGTFTLSLSTTPLGVNNLNETTNFDANLGTDTQLLATRTLTGTVDAVLSFTGPAFAYDPTLGDLLLDITVTGGSSTSLGFQEDTGNGGIMSRAMNFGAQFDNRGLVTEFVLGGTEIVAEPGMIAVFGIGMIGLGIMRRRMMPTDI
ncbi:MAG: hypothetical protein ACPGRZ_07045 [Alphaproteobacteria bacterium]